MTEVEDGKNVYTDIRSQEYTVGIKGVNTAAREVLKKYGSQKSLEIRSVGGEKNVIFVCETPSIAFGRKSAWMIRRTKRGDRTEITLRGSKTGKNNPGQEAVFEIYPNSVSIGGIVIVDPHALYALMGIIRKLENKLENPILGDDGREREVS